MFCGGEKRGEVSLCRGEKRISYYMSSEIPPTDDRQCIELLFTYDIIYLVAVSAVDDYYASEYVYIRIASVWNNERRCHFSL